MASMFIDTLPSPFYDKVVGSVTSNFADLVVIGERIEAGIKRGRFAQDRGNTSFVKNIEKRRGDTNAVITNPSRPQGQSKLVLSSTGIVSLPDPSPQAGTAATQETQNPRVARQRRVFTPIPMPYSTLFPLLLQKGMIAVMPFKPLEPPYPRSYDPSAKCDYHSGAVGHSTERCWSFKHKVQDLIEAGWLGFEGNKPNISTNPLPAHEGQAINTLSHSAFASDQEEEVVAVIGRQKTLPFQPLIIQCDPIRPTPLIITAPPRPAYKDNHAVPWHYDPVPEELPGEQTEEPPAEEITNIAEPGGMTRSGRIYTPANLGGKDPKGNPKGAPKEKEVEEFLKLIRYSEYELLDHLNKTPARISLLSLLLNSENHRNLLLKVLKEAHVAPDITTERFGGIIGNLTSSGRLTFSDEEIPAEGRQHNQPLHIAVKCGTYMITKVLIDNGSSLNVLPKATLDKLGSIHMQLKASPVIVRAFDGSRRDVMGEITLPIYIGPTLFHILFQVMDIRPAYSCLLGRPWIHGAGAVPSSLHQKVKFIADQQLVSIMGEQELVISTPVPDKYIEEEEEALETSFQALEIAASPEEPPSAAENMAFRVMIKEGYQPGKGLGPLLEGIPAPIEIQENKGRAGLGYQAGNQERARPARATWGQHFVRESVAMIDNQPKDQSGKDSSPIVEPVREGDAETEALAEVEMQIERERPKFQPLTKELESVNLGDERNKKEVRIGSQMSQESRKALIELLQEFSDIFAWSYRDMPGLDRSIVEHRLPMLPKAVPVRQQLRRMKPKDNFPLPHIDMLVDNTACHAFFSFMDGFS
ncbi:hypothetical protein CR513_23744, partial [Mucuna pruriens]